MSHTLTARLSSLVTPQTLRFVALVFALAAAFAVPQIAQAQAIGGSCGG